MKRFRVKYAKKEALKYTSGLEVHKLWERSIRRGHLPIAYSQGFHPQPRLNQAAPLPLGFTSLSEYMDIWFQDDITLEILQKVLPGVIPPGMDILSIVEMELSAPTMQNNVVSAEYQVTLLQTVDPEDLKEKIDHLLKLESLPRVRRDKTYDLRPLIEELWLMEPNGKFTILHMKLAARPGATGRPEEVMIEMGLDPLKSTIEKTETFFNF